MQAPDAASASAPASGAGAGTAAWVTNRSPPIRTPLGRPFWVITTGRRCARLCLINAAIDDTAFEHGISSERDGGARRDEPLHALCPTAA